MCGRPAEAGHPDAGPLARDGAERGGGMTGGSGAHTRAEYLEGVLKWLRNHPRWTDVAIVGGTAVLSVSLTSELGVVSALALGMAVILLANVLLGRLPSG
jgi:hypothetical protein